MVNENTSPLKPHSHRLYLDDKNRSVQSDSFGGNVLQKELGPQTFYTHETF